MHIKSFSLTQMGPFAYERVMVAPLPHYASRVTVLVGGNGAGKTTLLQSATTLLSWLVARIRTEKSNGTPIPESAIRNEASAASLSIEVIEPASGQVFTWKLARTRKGRKSDMHSVLSDAGRFADYYRELLTKDTNASLPLIAFYPVERSVIEIPLKIKTRHTFGQLDGYDNALSHGVDFRRFFEWFRDREDSENESGVSAMVLHEVAEKFGLGSELWHALAKLKASSRDRQLTAVRTAIEAFMPGFTNLRIQRKPRLHMAIDKAGSTLNVAQLSQGEKSLMALVGDIARRLAMMNPALENPLTGVGVVLIDEVDLHLHPRWQRALIRQFTTTFPNCQFILSTHSPLVISDAPDILCYALKDGELTEMPPLFGLDANQVLRIMDTDVRNEDIQEQLNGLQDLLQARELEAARALLDKLTQMLPVGHIELAKAELLLRKERLRFAQNY